MKSTQKPYKHHTVTQSLMRLHSSDGHMHKNKENYRIIVECCKASQFLRLASQ